MKNFSIVLLLFSALAFTGCFDIVEEMFVDSNGQGKYIITMDASGLMKDGGLRSMMQSMGGADEDSGDNPFASEDPIEVDTVMFMATAPDSIRSKFKHPELLDKMSMHQKISEAKELMTTSFVFEFENVGQINMFLEDMQNMSAGSGGLDGLGMSPGAMVNSPANGAPLFTLGKKMLLRSKAPVSEENKMDEESMAMMKMMLADATYSTIYNFPGKVKKTTIADASIDGKQLKVTYDLLDILDGKIDQSGTIKFAKK